MLGVGVCGKERRNEVGRGEVFMVQWLIRSCQLTRPHLPSVDNS